MPKKTKKKRGLSDKQRRFCLEYLKDLNATQAYIRAGYSKNGADVSACQLLGNPKIEAYIQTLKAQRARRTEASVDRVVDELCVLSFSDVYHYDFDERDGLVVVPDAPEGASRAVSQVKYRFTTDDDGRQYCNAEYKLWDKVASLEKLGRHLGMFVDKRQQNITIDSATPMVVRYVADGDDDDEDES